MDPTSVAAKSAVEAYAKAGLLGVAIVMLGVVVVKLWKYHNEVIGKLLAERDKLREEREAMRIAAAKELADRDAKLVVELERLKREHAEDKSDSLDRVIEVMDNVHVVLTKLVERFRSSRGGIDD